MPQMRARNRRAILNPVPPSTPTATRVITRGPSIAETARVHRSLQRKGEPCPCRWCEAFRSGQR